MHFRTLIIAGQAAEIVRHGRGANGGKAALEITIKDALKGSQWASSKQQTEGGSKQEGRQNGANEEGEEARNEGGWSRAARLMSSRVFLKCKFELSAPGSTRLKAKITQHLWLTE